MREDLEQSSVQNGTRLWPNDLWPYIILMLEECGLVVTVVANALQKQAISVTWGLIYEALNGQILIAVTEYVWDIIIIHNYATILGHIVTDYQVRLCSKATPKEWI